MSIPKPKAKSTGRAVAAPQEKTRNLDKDEKRQITLDDIDDPELRAELEAWERASIEDFLKFESDQE